MLFVFCVNFSLIYKNCVVRYVIDAEPLYYLTGKESVNQKREGFLSDAKFWTKDYKVCQETGKHDMTKSKQQNTFPETGQKKHSALS